jgi:hypothetical protein
MKNRPPIMSQLEDLTQQALEIHPEHPAEAAALLREAAGALDEGDTAQRDAWLRAAEHILLGHLADGEGLAALLPLDAARARAAIALAAGRSPDWQDLALADQIRAHYNAALARTRRRDFAGQGALLRAAQALSEGDDAVAQQALAAVANNVAADLRYYLKPGDGEAAAAMLEAAQLARAAWQRAGGWLQIERADWQLAMCAAAADRGELALQAARAGLQACEANGADDYEFCFAYQALGLAALAAGDLPQARRSRDLMAQRVALVTADFRDYAERCLAELDARLGA